MKETRSYPQSVFRALQQSPFENILDSNMFAVYISRELTIPRVQDPRRTQKPYDGISRHPSYVSSSYINQVFNYLGFIKRTQNSSYQQYLPVLFHELNHFLTVMEDIVYNLNIAAPVEVYEEQKKGLECFFNVYRTRSGGNLEWINDVWRHQKLYLERMDMLFETLKLGGRIFDFSSEQLYERIFSFCSQAIARNNLDKPNKNDLGLIANSCAKSALEQQPKIIWSGDKHMLEMLKLIYNDPLVRDQFPQIYLYSSYDPRDHAQWFPA
ncbi:MAG: hypothetical protein PHU49_15330 [Syntrophorhabdaceae bacterium]|nr:hypothetical protein [Syntrophorhabdaceae bacterium]MDD5245379.1 hypothetical protein [Syntrophorhabdaceae bacterium]